tara:strand:+ start:69 stop:290 length:222 start_codon:yes stop_codon:yes gene_type:complete
MGLNVSISRSKLLENQKKNFYFFNMKKLVLIIFLTLFLFNISQGDETSNKQKELETRIKLLEKELQSQKFNLL